jgi:serine/threonine protein kinase
MGRRGLQSGTVLAGYRVGEVIGRGGMGVVYEAEHAALRRTVALKVIAPELGADDEFRDRFLREAQLAASLEHPAVLPIYDAGEADGTLYLAMRRVRGGDLAARLRTSGPLPWDEALALFGPVAGALDTAHRQGLVHRDVKLQNILVEDAPDPSEPERVFLSDFGLSKRIGSATSLTRTGMFVGTLRYAAPEQLLGKSVDGRTDQYALACVLFECLCGIPPYPGETEAEIMFGHVWQPVPDLSARRPEVGPEVDRAMARAMAKEKEDRFPTCAALVAALLAARRDAPPGAAGGSTRIAAPPPPAGGLLQGSPSVPTSVPTSLPPRVPAPPPASIAPPMPSDASWPLQPPPSTPWSPGPQGAQPSSSPSRPATPRRGARPAPLVAAGALLIMLAILASASGASGGSVLAGLALFVGPPGLLALGLARTRSPGLLRLWAALSVLVGAVLAVAGVAFVAGGSDATAGLLVPAGLLVLAGGVGALRGPRPAPGTGFPPG